MLFRSEDILVKARTVTATPERQKLYSQAAEIILADRPHLILYHYRWFWGLGAKIAGFKPYPDGIIRLDGIAMN